MGILAAMADKFYALPFVAAFFGSHPILQGAAEAYGTLLFVILCVLALGLGVLLMRMRKPSGGRPDSATRPHSMGGAFLSRLKQWHKHKPATAEDIRHRLAQLPASTLPLYPVADKKRGAISALDTPPDVRPDTPADIVAAQAAPDEAIAEPPDEILDEAVDSLADDSADSLADAMTDDGGDALADALMKEGGFDQAPDWGIALNPGGDLGPDPGITPGGDFGLNPETEPAPDEISLDEAALDESTMDEIALDEPTPDEPTQPQSNPFGGGLTADDFAPPPVEDDIDDNSENENTPPEADGLSDEARRKFAELQQRGITN